MIGAYSGLPAVPARSTAPFCSDFVTQSAGVLDCTSPIPQTTLKNGEIEGFKGRQRDRP